MGKRAIRTAAGIALIALVAVVAVSLLTAGGGGARAFEAEVADGGGGYANQSSESQCASGGAVADPVSNAGMVADCDALLAAKSTLEGATGSLNWAANRSITQWEGVVAGSGRVTELDLDRKSLGGTIPTGLSRLDRLQVLELGDNQLTGGIPSELGDLGNLWALYLHNNRLTGAIPARLGDLSGLTELQLYNNQLSGSIPARLSDISDLDILDLSYNRLTGGIPSRLGNLDKLSTLSLSNNRLTGEIPPALGGMDALETLRLSNNRLAGEIPPELGDISTLRYLYLTGNSFTGCIPATLRDRLAPGQTAAAIGIPFCADAAATATPTPSATPETIRPVAPTATATRVPAATATRTPVPTATATRVPAGSAAVLDKLAALERQVAALTGRIGALEAAPTATPTPRPCVGAIREGSAVSGTWAAGCVTSHPPASNPGGTYYARFYTFTLDAASDVTITLSSADASPHLLLLRGAGTGGGMIHEASPFSVDPDTDVISISDTVAIRASLAAGSYTIEATTYYTNATGDFRLRLDAEDAVSVDGATWRRGRGAASR